MSESDTAPDAPSPDDVIAPDEVTAADDAAGVEPVDSVDSVEPVGGPAPRHHDKLPMRMLNDRILVKVDPDGDRRSSGGILIPATAQMGKRLAWAEVRAKGPNVRAVEEGDHVLFNPEDVYEVEVRGETFIILRERDIHALASERLEAGHTGLYL